ncbi:hypothetical protein AAFF_G00076410 [Aldrovandia affinis]|uniref:Myogenic determination factor 5 domain-containing protein n=1 Tax=Aldrovandia affinis TaxID=143900 RepID=A0AAD7WCR8_9TELE|nr:hypothetical protein AAFF_G00076410 [Aldrovandia affinis]
MHNHEMHYVSGSNGAPAVSSLECLSGIVDRLSLVDARCLAGNKADLSPYSSDCRPRTPETPHARPICHML